MTFNLMTTVGDILSELSDILVHPILHLADCSVFVLYLFNFPDKTWLLL